MAMTRAQFAKQLQDGLNAVFGMEYDEYPLECSQIFEVVKSDKSYEEDVLITGLGYAAEKAEGGEYALDQGQEAWTKRYTHRTIALSCAFTQEAIEDNRYTQLGPKYARALAKSLRQTKEVYCANVFNFAETSGYTGGDGVTLLSASHPLTGGGTFSNKLSTAADLSESALEQIMTQIRECKDDRGLPAMIKGIRLIVAPANEWNAMRILGSDSRPGTAENDINAIKRKGVFSNDPFVMTNQTDSNAWFVQTDCSDGLKLFSRTADVKPKTSVDPATDNVIYRVRERFSEGWSNPRAAFGSMGST